MSMSRTWAPALFLAALASAGLGAACGESFPPGAGAPPGDADAGGATAFATRPVRPQCAPYTPGPVRARVSFERLTAEKLFDLPVDIAVNAGRTYVVQQHGRLSLLSQDRQSISTVMDLTGQLAIQSESGLLGVAFHPKFAQNGFVYLSYTVPHPQQPPPAGVEFLSVVARFQSRDAGLTLDPTTEKRILVLDQPFGNHNGGKIAFGADTFLYFSLGDGGSGGDPLNSGQRKDTLLGKILRVDVDGGDPYAIPPTNPFAAGGGRPEIYALGLRNPWRFSFDAATGDLWVGDVGQGLREEIDKVVVGGNYGWKIREGKTCYNAATCDTTGLVDPIVDYGRDDGASVTGGVVYRGTRLADLTGKYVYGDYSSGRMWAIGASDPAPVPVRIEEGLARVYPSVFALDAEGEVIFADYLGGALHRFGPPPGPEAPLPVTLAATQCMDEADPTKPGAGLVPYAVRVPQWADGATATRHLSLPERAKIGVLEGGRLMLPPRSVALRLVTREKRLVEAQIIQRTEAGAWDFYAYTWKDGTGDAALVPEGGARVALPSGREHVIVGRAQCRTCHNEAAGVTLGLEIAQLDRDVDYPSGTASQLAALAAVQILPVLDAGVPYARLPLVDGVELTEPRARAYLHANCSSCHRGGDPTALDLRFSTPLRETRACDVGARIVPGNADASLIVSTMRTEADGRMPPIASLAADPAGVRVVEDWVRLLSACP